MDDLTPEVKNALLEWVNKAYPLIIKSYKRSLPSNQVNTFNLDHRITSWSELEDGQILWQILADIDSNYFSESLPNFDDNVNRRQSASDNWVQRWQNMKHIERTVSTYIRETCGQLPALSKRMIPDLKNGARDRSEALTAKLTMAVLLAACYSPTSNQRIIMVMQKLGKPAEVIMTAIEAMQELDERMAKLGVDQELTPDPLLPGHRTPSRAVSMERDAGLEQEAQLFEANKDRKRLRDQVNELSAELSQSKEKILTLEEQLVESRLHLDVGGSQNEQSVEVEKLRIEVEKERQYIAELEADLAATKDQLEKSENQLERLKSDTTTKQDLKDKIQLVEAERDELVQKVKANENFKKKIQSMSQELKTLESLRQEHQHCRERIAELEPLEERVVALEKVNKENASTIVQCETSIFEEKGKRTRVEHDNHILQKQLEQTRELLARAEDARRELELEASAHGPRGSSLEDELRTPEEGETTILEDSKLSEPQITSETISLKQKLAIMEARVKSLESEYLKLVQENLGLRSDLTTEQDEEGKRYGKSVAVQVAKPLIQPRPYLEKLQKLEATEKELQESQQNIREKEAEISELRNELTKNGPDGAKTGENDRLVAQVRELTNLVQDYESKNREQAHLLRAAVLNRDNLPPALEELRRAETLRRIRTQLERVIDTKTDERPRVMDAVSTKIADEVVSTQVALEKSKKVSNAQLKARQQKSAATPAMDSIKSKHTSMSPRPQSLNVLDPHYGSTSSRPVSVSASSVASKASSSKSKTKKRSFLSNVAKVFSTRGRVDEDDLSDGEEITVPQPSSEVRWSASNPSPNRSFSQFRFDSPSLHRPSSGPHSDLHLQHPLDH